MSAVDGVAAARWLLSLRGVDPGMCLHYVWRAYAAVGARTERSAPTATDGWYRSDGKHWGDRNPPAGVLVWWGPNSSSNAGDVVISLGGGRVVATDYPRWGVVGVCTITERERQIARPYLGWTESIFDQPIDFEGREDDMSAAAEKQIDAIHKALFGPGGGTEKTSQDLRWLDKDGGARNASYGLLDIVIENQNRITANRRKLDEILEAVTARGGLTKEQVADLGRQVGQTLLEAGVGGASVAEVDKIVRGALGDLVLTPGG